MGDADRPREASVEALDKELRDVRTLGYPRVGCGTREDKPTGRIEEAAESLPGFSPNTTRAGKVELVLRAFIPLTPRPYNEWLAVSFGIGKDPKTGEPLDPTKPTSLRTIAAKMAGKSDDTFARTDEKDAIGALARQVAAGYPAPVTKTRIHRWRFITAVGAAAVLAASTIVAVTSLDGSPTGDEQPVDAIRATITNVHSAGGEWSVAFSADQRAEAQKMVEYVDEDWKPGDSIQDLLDKEIEAGAYLLGAMELGVNLEGLVEGEVTINDIRVVEKQRQDPALDTAIIHGTEGGGPSDLVFVLDHAVPVAKASDRLEDKAPPFFIAERPWLPKGGKWAFNLYFVAQEYAYTFELDIHYEVDGQQRVLRLNRDGEPFRVTADPCDSTWSKDGNIDRERAAKMPQYETVRRFNMLPADKGDPRFESIPSDSFEEICIGGAGPSR